MIATDHDFQPSLDRKPGCCHRCGLPESAHTAPTPARTFDLPLRWAEGITPGRVIHVGPRTFTVVSDGGVSGGVEWHFSNEEALKGAPIRPLPRRLADGSFGRVGPTLQVLGEKLIEHLAVEDGPDRYHAPHTVLEEKLYAGIRYALTRVQTDPDVGYLVLGSEMHDRLIVAEAAYFGEREGDVRERRCRDLQPSHRKREPDIVVLRREKEALEEEVARLRSKVRALGGEP